MESVDRGFHWLRVSVIITFAQLLTIQGLLFVSFHAISVTYNSNSERKFDQIY